MNGRGPDMPRKAGCCCGAPDEVVQLDLVGDGVLVGLVGLNRIFEQLYVMGRAPDAAVQDELLKMVAAKNYVPSRVQAEYAAGLLREYRKFCEKKQKLTRSR